MVSITDLTKTGGNIQLASATIKEVGTYQLVLTATEGDVTISAKIEMEIADPCSTAIFETNPPL